MNIWSFGGYMRQAHLLVGTEMRGDSLLFTTACNEVTATNEPAAATVPICPWCRYHEKHGVTSPEDVAPKKGRKGMDDDRKSAPVAPIFERTIPVTPVAAPAAKARAQAKPAKEEPPTPSPAEPEPQMALF